MALKPKKRVIFYLGFNDWDIKADQIAGSIAEKIYPCPKRIGNYEDKDAVKRYLEEKNQYAKFIKFAKENRDICFPYVNSDGDLTVKEKGLRAYFKTTDFVLEIRRETEETYMRKSQEWIKRSRGDL